MYKYIYTHTNIKYILFLSNIKISHKFILILPIKNQK